MIRQAVDSFTRPSDTTAYAANDLVANSTTAGSVVPMQFKFGPGGGKVVGIRIAKTDETDVANATFSIRLFDSSPTVANGDNGAISHNLADVIGIVPLAIMVAATDEGWTKINAGEANFVDGLYFAGSEIFGLLEAEAAYAPASAEVFTVTLYVDKT